MRQFIVKHFALDYIVKVFGVKINFVRAANWIWPLMLLGGYKSIHGGFTDLVGISILFILAVALFFGFVYFQLRPVKWNELDDLQKWQYGMAVKSGKLTKKIPFTKSMQAEWNLINDTMIYRISKKRFYRVYLLLWNIIWTILIISLL